MPNIPVTWLEEFNVTATSGPSDPDIIQLDNGNILVSWTSSDPARPGASGASDTIGQIFDPMGVAVGGPFRINQGFFADDEIDADLAAVPGGGFMAVYEDVETTGTPLRANVYDATGAVIFTTTIESDSNAATQPNFRDPHVAVSSSTSALVVYQFQDAGGTRIAGRIYDPSTGTLGSQISLIGFSLNESDPDVAVLSNGNYVITCTDLTGGDNRIAFRVVDAAGGNVISASFVAATNADGFSDTESSVTALAGGGFAIAYTDVDANDTDVTIAIFDAAGVQTGTANVILANSATNLTNEATITALSDGSFIVIVDDDQADNMVASHFSATGSSLGNFVFSGPGTSPSVTDLGDGRFAVTWQSLDATGGVRMEILDTRDFVNAQAVYNPEPNWQVGTIFSDTIVTDVDSDIVHGHLGDDDITDSTSSGGNQYFGDQGNDILRVGNNIDTDLWDGGADTDTLDLLANTQNGLIIDLDAGTIVEGVNTETAINFENVNGTNQDDSIRGTAGANTLVGRNGADNLQGRAGSDTFIYNTGEAALGEVINGGADDDRVLVQSDETFVNASFVSIEEIEFDPSVIADRSVTVAAAQVGAGLAANLVLDFNANNTVDKFRVEMLGATSVDLSLFQIQDFDPAGTENDRIIILGDSDDESMRGTIFRDELFGQDGNDVLEGGQADDLLSGGLGSDRASYANGGPVTVNLSDATKNTGEATGDTYNSIENLTGSGFNDDLTGTNGGNSIIAGAGDDTVFGLNGDDSMFGQDGNDILNGGVGGDALSGGLGSDRATYADAAAGVTAALLSPATNTGDAAGDTYTSIENLTGSAFADTLKGTNSTNSLIGGEGDDTIVGFGGDDNLFGQDGNDVLNGGTGADALSGGLGSDRATYENATTDIVAALLSPATNTGEAAGDSYTSIENLTGSGFDDTLTGTNSINSLIGGGGKDTLIGLGGDDNLFGQDGDDTFIGGAGADDFSGGNGTDTASYETAAAGVVASFIVPAGNTGDAAGDTYSSIENLTGSAFGDTLTGNNAINVIVGGGGSDTIVGRLGNDTLTGNAGKDQFVFDTAVGAANVDTITDFVFVDDTIRLDDAIFNAIVGGTGTLSAGQFVANAPGLAGDADDRIIYETDTGNIFYDTNGNAAGGSTLFAIVGAGLGITNADFLII
ncbi:calcium-binding protein [Mesorhizobium sp. CN2-181]|uniref:beta strand repeat-containing protein n=1 Tax=Mesorhizobium yinganensis TaxID=3157707 RepID=UPI0032B857C7